MVRSLRARNLQVNALKTKYVHNQAGKQVIQVGDAMVEGERDGTVTVLGALIAMTGEVTQLLAEVFRRARRAFAMYKKLLVGAGSVDHKMLAYTRYVATSALWAIGAAHPHDSLLRGINSIQLIQLRQVLHIERRTLEKWVQWFLEASKSAPGSKTQSLLVHYSPHTDLEIMGTHCQAKQGYGTYVGVAQSGMVARRTKQATRPQASQSLQCDA